MKILPIFILFIFIVFINLRGDPQLIWSTYVGSNGNDTPSGFRIDTAGNTFIAGSTDAANFPITPGAYNKTFSGTMSFITELDSLGSNLIFSTFIGPAGSNYLDGSTLTFDKYGNCYLTGIAHRTYPTTHNAFDTTFDCVKGNLNVVYVTKLNPAGDSLIYSTYICSGYGYTIEIDSSLNSYITGNTNTHWFPTTPGAYCTKFHDSIWQYDDIFITKLKPNADSLIYSTYIGGTREDHSFDIKIDDLGYAYITGNTNSTDFPTTKNAYLKSKQSSISDIIISKLNQTGDSLVYSTYFGGVNDSYKGRIFNGEQDGYSIATDPSKNVYFTGSSSCFDYPTTQGAYNTIKNCNTGWFDIIITKLNSSGDSLIFSTFLGGSSGNNGSWVKLDKYNNVYIIGQTWADDYPVTDSSFYGNFIDGANNPTVIISKLNNYGNSLIYSTYLSGGINELGFALNIYNKYIYACGKTYSNQFPITLDAYDTSYNGGGDVFITKLGPIKGRPNIHAINNIIFPDLVCGDIDTTITIINSGNNILNLTKARFVGKDSLEFKIIQPNKYPVSLQPDDTLKLVIRYISTKNEGIKNDTLYLENNTYINPFKISISLINGIDYTVNNSESDTIIIDFGKFCPGKSTFDTTITIFNKSSIGTTFKIENKDPKLQITPVGKPEKKVSDNPLNSQRKKSKKKK
jgi:hypothetical protein